MLNLKQKINSNRQPIDHMQQRMEEMITKQNAKLKTQAKALDTKLQEQMNDLYTKLQQQTKDLDTKLQQQTADLALLINFTHHDFTLTEFKKHQAKGGGGDWYSDEFYNRPGGYRFQLNICTNGVNVAHGTHLTAGLYLQDGGNDNKLKWPIKCTVHLQMLNQRGDHGHHTVIRTGESKTKGNSWFSIGNGLKFSPLDKLGYCANQNTEYLKNDRLKFRMYLKVESV